MPHINIIPKSVLRKASGQMLERLLTVNDQVPALDYACQTGGNVLERRSVRKAEELTNAGYNLCGFRCDFHVALSEQLRQCRCWRPSYKIQTK